MINGKILKNLTVALDHGKEYNCRAWKGATDWYLNRYVRLNIGVRSMFQSAEQ